MRFPRPSHLSRFLVCVDQWMPEVSYLHVYSTYLLCNQIIGLLVQAKNTSADTVNFAYHTPIIFGTLNQLKNTCTKPTANILFESQVRHAIHTRTQQTYIQTYLASGRAGQCGQKVCVKPTVATGFNDLAVVDTHLRLVHSPSLRNHNLKNYRK